MLWFKDKRESLHTVIRSGKADNMGPSLAVGSPGMRQACNLPPLTARGIEGGCVSGGGGGRGGEWREGVDRRRLRQEKRKEGGGRKRKDLIDLFFVLLKEGDIRSSLFSSAPPPPPLPVYTPSIM